MEGEHETGIRERVEEHRCWNDMKRKWKCCTFCAFFSNKKYMKPSIISQHLYYCHFIHSWGIVFVFSYPFTMYLLLHVVCVGVCSKTRQGRYIVLWSMKGNNSIYFFISGTIRQASVWLFDAVNMILPLLSHCCIKFTFHNNTHTEFANEFFNYIYWKIIFLYTWMLRLMTCIILSCTSFLE